MWIGEVSFKEGVYTNQTNVSVMICNGVVKNLTENTKNRLSCLYNVWMANHYDDSIWYKNSFIYKLLEGKQMKIIHVY